MMTTPEIFFLVLNAVSTWYTDGLIWMVQLVHYPLFDAVGREGFSTYQQRHQWLTSFAVGPAMLVEAGTALGLAWYPPPGAPLAWILIGIGLVLVIWFSTGFLQVPCHGKLEQGFDQRVHRRLVRTNWIRTAAWSLRGLLTLGLLVAALTAS